jgi:hypothetical protein
MMMSRAARLALLVLVTVVMGFAQTPSGGNNMPANSNSAAQSSNEQNSAEQNSPQENSTPQNSTQQSFANQNSGAGQIAAGTEIHATLDTPLSAKTSKPGDRFTATIADEVRGSDPANGSILIIPGGARLEGEVAEPEESKAVALKGSLSLRFRDVVLPNGQTLPLTATLISVHATKGKAAKKVEEEARLQPNASGASMANGAGIGAGVGMAGLVFGAPVKGVAIGALAGGGYVVATNGKDVNLPAQTGMVIRLDQSISWNGTSASIR